MCHFVPFFIGNNSVTNTAAATSNFPGNTTRFQQSMQTIVIPVSQTPTLVDILRNCTSITLVDDRELVSSCDLPDNFWADDFSNVVLPQEFVDAIDRWWLWNNSTSVARNFKQTSFHTLEQSDPIPAEWELETHFCAEHSHYDDLMLLSRQRYVCHICMMCLNTL